MSEFEMKFQQCMKEPFIQIPQKWGGKDLIQHMSSLYNKFTHELDNLKLVDSHELDFIKNVCDGLTNALREYYNGKPAQSYIIFSEIMDSYTDKYNSFVFYEKSDYFGRYNGEDPLRLYRVRKIKEVRAYDFKEIFHTPFSKRTTVSTCRYSIAGYPSMYLGTSIDLCIKETGINRKSKALVAKFNIDRDILSNHIDIKVLDLAIKPSDFDKSIQDNFTGINLSSLSFQRSYLQLYPLISACSIIAYNKTDPFVPEYIIPQLLMQWVRGKNDKGAINDSNHNFELCGIRYFSCRTIPASNKSFNYVFPVCHTNAEVRNITISEDMDYCDVLSKAFKFTSPVILNNYYSNEECEEDLNSYECKHRIL